MVRSFRLLIMTLLALILFFPGKAISGPTKNVRAVDVLDSVALENSYVTVMHNIVACSQVHTPNYGSRVLVALTELKIESSKGSMVLQRGEIAVFLVGES